MIDIIQTIPPRLVAQHTAQSRLVVYPDDWTPCDPKTGAPVVAGLDGSDPFDRLFGRKVK